MPKGTQVEVMTPAGANEKRYLAGVLELTTGTITHCVWYQKTTGLFVDLLDTLDRTHPTPLFTHLTVVFDNAKVHQAEKVKKQLAAQPRFELLYLPTYCVVWSDLAALKQDRLSHLNVARHSLGGS